MFRRLQTARNAWPFAIAALIGAGLAAGCGGDPPTEPAAPEPPLGSTAAAPARLGIVSGNNQVGAIRTPLLQPLVVRVTDAGGTGVPNVTVTFRVTGGGGSVSPISAKTGSTGSGSARLTLGSKRGSSTVEVSVPGLAAVTFMATARVPAKLTIVSGNNQTGTVGFVLPKPLVVKLMDANGLIVPGPAISFAVKTGGGTTNPASSRVNAKGQAKTNWTLGQTAAGNTIAASVKGFALTPARFSAVARAPDFSLSCTPSPVSVPQASSTTVTCTATSLSGFAGAVTVSAGTVPTGITVAPFVPSVTLTANASALVPVSVSTAADVPLGSLAYTLRGTSGGITRTFNGQLIVSTNTARVHIVYLVPSDRTVQPGFVQSTERAIRHLQIWYRTELGLGKTFTLTNPVVAVLQTSHTTSWYNTNGLAQNGATTFWTNALSDGFALTGGGFYQPADVWVFYIDADADPGQAVGGVAGVALLPAADLRGLVGQSSEPVCRWVGGLGHELGHALGLPHPPSCDPTQTPSCPVDALMWFGYTTYPNATLTSDDRQTLGQSAFFTSLTITTQLFGCSQLTSTTVVAGATASPRTTGERYERTCGYGRLRTRLAAVLSR